MTNQTIPTYNQLAFRAESDEKRPHPESSPHRLWLTGIFVIVVLWLLNLFRLYPSLGEYQQVDHLWATSQCLQEAQNYYEDGVLHNFFAQIMTPRSIEATALDAQTDLFAHPAFAGRALYFGLPPSAPIALWLCAELLAHPPTLLMVQGLNLLCMLAVTLCLFAGLLGALRDLPSQSAFAGALIGALFYLLSERPLLVHYGAFMSETAALAPIALLLCHELRGRPRFLTLLLYPVMFFGGLCEPLAYFLAAALFIRHALPLLRKRQILKLLRSTAYLTLPLILALTFIVSQDLYLDIMERTLSHLSMRSELNTDSLSLGEYLSRFKSVALATLLVLVLVSALYTLTFRHVRMVWQQTAEAMKVALIMLAVSVLHVAVFYQWNWYHNFLDAKFYLAAAIICGTCLGICHSLWTTVLRTLLYLGIGLSLLWSSTQTIKFINELPEVPLVDYARVIGEDQRFNDIYLSAEFSFYDMPPFWQTLSRKRVYQLPLSNELFQKFIELDGVVFKFVATAQVVTPHRLELMRSHGFIPRHFYLKKLPDLYIFSFTKENLDTGIKLLFSKSDN